MEMGVFGINVRPVVAFLHSSSCFGGSVGPTLVFSPIVTFRMVVFRPFVSEVILAKVKSSDEDGIRRMFASRILSTQITHVSHSFGWILR